MAVILHIINDAIIREFMCTENNALWFVGLVVLCLSGCFMKEMKCSWIKFVKNRNAQNLRIKG